MYDMQIDRHEGRGRVLTAEFEKFYLVSAYTPNSGEGLKGLHYRLNEWDVDFPRYLQALQQRKPVILGGDLNVCRHEMDRFKPKIKEPIP